MAAAKICFGSLDLPDADVARLILLLAPDEQDRAARFAFARDRRRFVVRRARLREILAMATGVTAGRIGYAANRYGKPVLAAGGPCFSTSHSHELWAVALSEHELGVDVEYRQPDIAWRDLAAGLFAPAECDALDGLATPDAARGFFDCWARKEAFVKAIGLGLSHPLDSFTVSVTPEARLLDGAAGWTIAALDLADGYSAALVIEDNAAPVSTMLRRYPA